MTGQYAAETSVPVARSRNEIEAILQRYGATEFAYGWDPTMAVIMFNAHGRSIRFRLPLPDRAARDITYSHNGTRRRTPQQAQTAWEQAERQRWRALALVIKAKLEAVAVGIVTFEDEFLAQTMLPGTGQTVGEWAQPQLADTYGKGGPLALMP